MTSARLRGFSSTRTRAAFVLALLGAIGAVAAPSCTTETTPGTSPGGTEPTLRPGDFCSAPSPDVVKLRFEPSRVFLAKCADGSTTCASRSVRLVAEPDFCTKTPIRFETSSADITPAPKTDTLDLYKAGFDVAVVAGKTSGSASVKAFLPRGDGTDAEATLEVEVLDTAGTTDLTCAAGDSAAGSVEGGKTITAKGGLATASLGLPERASDPNKGSFLWSVPKFDATIGCGDAKPPSGYDPLGPAVTFGPVASKFQRDVPMTIPINPARMPDQARLRHLAVSYSGPAFKEPRVVPVADARIVKMGDGWALSFKAPRLGTYQAVVEKDAGTSAFPRRLTHRAILGVSMGGGGTAMFGMRHHHLFDALAPLGGPVDWTWMLDAVKRHYVGGFRPIPKGTVLADINLEPTLCQTKAECAQDETCLGVIDGSPGKCAWTLPPRDPYEHTQVFNQWWFEYPRNGTGGSFSREAYVQIFRDLAAMFGNPNGENLTPGAENLPAGVRPDDLSQTGGRPTDECAMWVDPLDGPDKDKQEELAQNCPKERCANTLTLTNYFDDEFNPDGTFPVITVCDGSPQKQERTPYANWWTPEGNTYPLELALAVDYNGNGTRDELEPIIRAGHEPWDDVGKDGIPSNMEPGYMPGVNEDPAGDDYDAQYNPGGTERNMRFDDGEPFKDVGLDGVAGTKQQPPGGWQKAGDGYDVGEGDGKFTVASGLDRFWERDAHSIVHRITREAPPGGELDDAALRRIDVWTDGGTRDLFNFAVSAQHLTGAFGARKRNVTYFSDFTQHPELDPGNLNGYAPSRVPYADLPGIVLQRYGKLDPTASDIESGSGQHVGTANELVARLQGALYFISARWPDQDLRTLVLESNDDADPEAEACEVQGACSFDFKSTLGRVGPVSVALPPGYAHKTQKERRYPVVYALHGYGQEPKDLVAAATLIKTFMNAPTDSVESRLPKMILVFVDGRCRVGPDGKAECIRGTFFGESPLQSGAKLESWWLELMNHVDANYRTMGESESMWTE
ncbi:MAG TPA: hypothetical protein VM694_25905 [Polyangium sp.]|nr:hypothetical protein [Polyangium sp.]